MSVQMVMLDKNGRMYAKLGACINTKGLVVPAGDILSWEHHFMGNIPAGRLRLAILDHRSARVLIRPMFATVIARIESPSAVDMHEAIELVTLYLGGSVETFSPTGSNANSFFAGVKNDLMNLKQTLVRRLRSVRQRVGFKMAG